MENPFSSIGRMLIIFGLLIILIGAILLFGGKIPGLGRLPGDIMIKRGNFTFYFPLTTGILISILLSLLLALLSRR